MANQSLGRYDLILNMFHLILVVRQPASWGRGEGSSNASTQATSQGSCKITLGGLNVDIDY